MPQLFVVDKNGKRLSELTNAVIDEVEWELNAPGTCQFTIPTDDPKLVYPKNWLVNPSFEGDQGNGLAPSWGWGESHAAITNSFAKVRGGTDVVHGMEAQQFTSGNMQAENNQFTDIYYPPQSGMGVTPGETITASLYLRVTALLRAKVVANIGYVNDQGNWFVSSPNIMTLTATTGAMTRYSITHTVPAGAIRAYLYVRLAGGAAATIAAPGNATVIVDAAQMERGSLSDFSDEPFHLPRVGKDEIQVWENDQLIWWGVPWTVRGTHERMTVNCQGLLSYFMKRFLTTTSLEYASLDQHTIGWNLVNYAQTGAYRDLDVVAGQFNPSGKVRSRRYEREEHPNILDLLEEFPTLQDGFDFDIVIDGTGRREWWPYYPSKGSVKNELALHWGRNIVSYTYNEDAVDMANHVYVTGGTDGDIKFENNYQDAAAAAEYGSYEAITSHGSYLDVNWLLERAIEEVDKRKRPIKIPELVVKRDPVDILHLLHTGDIVPVRLDHGRTKLRDSYRVVRKSWKPSDNTLTLTMNVVEQ